MIAEEALYRGAPLAHVAAYNERNRLARIDASNRAAFRRMQARRVSAAFDELCRGRLA